MHWIFWGVLSSFLILFGETTGCPCQNFLFFKKIKSKVFGSGSGRKVKSWGYTWVKGTTQTRQTTKKGSTGLKLSTLEIGYHMGGELMVGSSNGVSKSNIRHATIAEFTNFGAISSNGECVFNKAYEECDIFEYKKGCESDVIFNFKAKAGRGNWTHVSLYKWKGENWVNYSKPTTFDNVDDLDVGESEDEVIILAADCGRDNTWYISSGEKWVYVGAGQKIGKKYYAADFGYRLQCDLCDV